MPFEFKPNPADYRWCFHCHIGFHFDDGVTIDGELTACPTIGCNSGWGDFWEWTYVANVGGYPEIPDDDKIYPLYGRRSA